jgi:hypothetical protein
MAREGANEIVGFQNQRARSSGLDREGDRDRDRWKRGTECRSFTGCGEEGEMRLKLRRVRIGRGTWRAEDRIGINLV